MKNEVRSALLKDYTEPIRDTLWGHIYLTPALAALTESAPFIRLHRIMQLGPAFRVYPGATHTRASHSIGVYHLARRLLTHLTEEGADNWLSPEGVKSFLCAALLHDLGHFPYTHSLKELPLKEHEVLTAEHITAEPLKSLVAAAGGDPCFTAAIVDAPDHRSDSHRSEDKKSEKQRSGDKISENQSFGKGEERELLFYRKLLSGALDPDKLDYLSRDGRYCGVPYGAQDVDHTLSRLHPHPERGVDIDSRGISGVESLLFSKYLMYRTVYWHRSVRSATAMVKKAILGGLESGHITGEELYNLDDQGLFALAAKLDHPLFTLVDSVRSGRLFTVAAEIPFDEEAYEKLLFLHERSRMEESLAAEYSSVLGKPLGAGALIIDLPEPVSFECGLYVTDENRFFPDSTSAFKSGLLDALVKSLRIIRVFVAPDYEDEIKTLREEILQITQKWLQYM